MLPASSLPRAVAVPVPSDFAPAVAAVPDLRVASWPRAIAGRMAALWPVKMVGTTVWIAAFFWLYFWVMRHPAPGTVAFVMPVTAVDRLFAVHDWAIVPYASLWFYVALAPALSRAPGRLGAYCASALFLCVLGLACFWLFPTAVPHFQVDWQVHPALAFLKSRDGGANACPSLHVAFAVQSAAWIAHELGEVGAPRRVRALNLAWAAIVVYSVLATRQHVFLDIVGGVAAGLLAAGVAAAARRRLG